MKKTYFGFIALLLCAVLCFSACSSAKLSRKEITALRNEYPSFEFQGHPMFDFSIPYYRDMEQYISRGISEVAVVEICGQWNTQPYNASPVEEKDTPLLSPSLNIAFLPVRVITHIAGNNPNVTEGAELMIHFGTIDLHHREMIQALQPGKQYVFMMIPSEGFVPEYMEGDNVFTSGADGIFHITENDLVLSFAQHKILEQYAGMPLEKFQKEMQELFQNVDTQED